MLVAIISPKGEFLKCELLKGDAAIPDEFFQAAERLEGDLWCYYTVNNDKIPRYCKWDANVRAWGLTDAPDALKLAVMLTDGQ